jgi:hypothetical protein
MAKSKLINCGTCNEEMARSAKTCPKCGAKNKKRRSGCATAFGVVALLIGLRMAVNDGIKGAEMADGPTTFSMNEPALVETAEWIITGVREGSSVEYMTTFDYMKDVSASSSESKIVYVEGKLTNRGKKEVASFSEVILVDSESINYGSHADNYKNSKNLNMMGSLNPNITKEFALFFEVPKSATGLKFAAPSFNGFSKKRVLIDLNLDKQAVEND